MTRIELENRIIERRGDCVGVTIAEAARMVGMSQATWYRYLADGNYQWLPKIRRAGERRLVVYVCDLFDWMEKREVVGQNADRKDVVEN
ncbi:MAG: hypothetical protein ABW165_14440 [Candidatus Thiodiazotropha sp.]